MCSSVYEMRNTATKPGRPLITNTSTAGNVRIFFFFPVALHRSAGLRRLEVDFHVGAVDTSVDAKRRAIPCSSTKSSGGSGSHCEHHHHILRLIGFRSFPLLQLMRRIPDTICLLYTSPSPRDLSTSRMPSSA